MVFIRKFILSSWNSATITSWFNFSSTILSGILLLPLASKYLSIEELSFWLLLSIFSNLNQLADFGFNSSFVRSIAHAYGGESSILIYRNKASIRNNNLKPNWEFLFKIFSTTNFIYFFLAILFSLLIGLIGFYGLQKSINLLTDPMQGWICLLVVISSLFMKIFGNKYQIFLEGINLVSVVQRNKGLINSITIILASISLITQSSLLNLVILQQFGALLIIFSLYLKTKSYIRLNGLSHYKKASVSDKKIIYSLFPIAWRTWIGVLMSYGLLQFSGIILAQYETSALIVAYLFSIKIFEILKGFSNVPFYSQIPKMNILFIKKEFQKLNSIFKLRGSMTTIIFTLSAMIIGLFNVYLFNYFDINIELLNFDLWLVLSLAFLLERYGALHIQFLTLSNNIIWHIANGITGLLYVLLFIIFNKLDYELVESISFSFFLANLLFYFWYPAIKSYRFYKLNFIKLELFVSFPPILIILLSIFLNFYFD